jgi:hypothetical protein
LADQSVTLEDPLREALRLIALADERNLPLRLLGGLAFHAKAPEWTARISRALYFVDPTWERPVDVLVDKLDMCHMFEFGDRLTIDHPTLPLADLLLSKLQVVRINRKDVLDGLILLAEHPLAESDREGISVPRIVGLTSSDWGWWRTITMNLDKMRLYYEVELTPQDLDTGRPHPFDPVVQIGEMRSAIDAASKSTKWKLRSRVGDRVAWYQEPEEIGHG